MTERAVVLLIILAGGSLLTCARRYKNAAPDAGYGIAGATIVFCFLWLGIWSR